MMSISASFILKIVIPILIILMAYIGHKHSSSSNHSNDTISAVTQYPPNNENGYGQHIERIIFTAQDIEHAVQALAKQISADYQGKQVLLVGLMRGAYHMLSDISRHLSIPHEIDVIGVTTYSGQKSTHKINLYHELQADVQQKHIVIIEDLCDTAFTLHWLINDYFVHSKTGHESLSVCCLLDKEKAKRVPDYEEKVKPYVKYVGFAVDDVFVVGYGMDYHQHYRSLPYIGVLKKEIYETEWSEVLKDLHQLQQSSVSNQRL